MDRMKAPFRVANTLALFMIAYALLVSPSSAAPLGPGFEYQGRIGNLTGSYDFRFRLFNAATGGAQVYATTATATDVPVSNGEYRTALRFGDGVVPYLSGEALYVEVEYRVATNDASAPYTLQTGARAQLMPHAYAMSLRPGATTRGNLTTPIYTARNTGSGAGVWGESTGGAGVYGRSSSWIGVHGESQTQTGVHGRSTSWLGVHGESSTQTGVLGKSMTGVGVWGDSRDWVGVFGISTKNDGISGITQATGKSGVYGVNNTSGGYGVYGSSTNGRGVAGLSTSNAGVTGTSSSSTGVAGQSTTGTGTTGQSNSWYGVYGLSATGVGVVGNGGSGYAMLAQGNVTQSLSGGGFVKAMAVIDPYDGADPIKHCFNSQLPGTQATSGDCGLKVYGVDCGTARVVDFGFDVSNRVVSVTPFVNNGGSIGVNLEYPGPNEKNTVRVVTYYATETWYNKVAMTTCAKFNIIVY